MSKALKNFWKDEEGAALIEYSILIGIIAVTVIAAVTFVGGWVDGRWSALQTALTPAP